MLSHPIPYLPLIGAPQIISRKLLTHSADTLRGGSDFIMQELAQKEKAAGEEVSNGR